MRYFPKLDIAAIIVLALLFAFTLAKPVFAQTEETIVAENSVWYSIWAIAQPLVVTLATIVGPVIAVWLSAKLASLLNVTDAAKRQEIEERLRQALHEAALNGLKYAFSTHAKGLVEVPSVINPEIINAAVRYVKDKNPDATAAFHLNDNGLREIVMSKVPDVKAVLNK